MAGCPPGMSGETHSLPPNARPLTHRIWGVGRLCCNDWQRSSGWDLSHSGHKGHGCLQLLLAEPRSGSAKIGEIRGPSWVPVQVGQVPESGRLVTNQVKLGSLVSGECVEGGCLSRSCREGPAGNEPWPLSVWHPGIGNSLHEGCVHTNLFPSCLTLCNPMDCSLPGSSVHGDSPGKNPGAGCHFLLQGIFPTQGSNLCLLRLLHCRWILYH